MAINRWWDADAFEIYWLETTERDDIGVDVHAPQLNDQGAEHHGYSQINEIRPGDVVLHYHKGSSAIIGWSRVQRQRLLSSRVVEHSTHTPHASLPNQIPCGTREFVCRTFGSHVFSVASRRYGRQSVSARPRGRPPARLGA